MMEKDDALFYKWKGTIDRTPNYYSTIADLELNGVPQNLWERLSEVCDSVKVALEESKPTIKKEAADIFTKKSQAETFENVQPLFYDRNNMWWLWDEKKFKWAIVDEVDMLNMIEEATGKDIINPKERTLILNALKQTGRKRIPKDAKPTWLQFKDKIYDLETNELFDASPEYFITNPIPYEVEMEKYDTPNMDRIFTEWVGEENVEKLYEIISYCLLPDYPINRIFCFIGGGMNGKSKFLELLRKFIGTDNCCSTELDTLINSRFEVTRLHKKLVCQMGETNFSELNKTSILKKLSGGDLIGFEYKNKNPFEEKNYAKIIIATNNLPTTSDKTIGFYRRWMIIDFPNRFTEKKDILSEIPEEEYNSLALRCCVTLRSLLENREFTNEGSIEERMSVYESRSNFLKQFLKEYTVESTQGHITKSDFKRKFIDWAKENRHREMSDIAISKQMKQEGIDDGRIYLDWMYDGKGGQARAWLGIIWK